MTLVSIFGAYLLAVQQLLGQVPGGLDGKRVRLGSPLAKTLIAALQPRGRLERGFDGLQSFRGSIKNSK